MSPDIMDVASDLGSPSPFDLHIGHLVREGWTDAEILEHVLRMEEALVYAPKRYWEVRISSIRADAGSAQESHEPNYNGITLSMILAARRSHNAEGHTSEATHNRLIISKSTLLRARHKLGLVPWPDGLD